MAELIRSYRYDENGEPYMSLTTKRARSMGNWPVAVRLQDLWMFAENKNPKWREFMARYSQQVIHLLDLGEATTWRMGAVADVIAAGIDELVKMPPAPTKIVPMEGTEVKASLSVDGGPTVKVDGGFEVEVIDIY